MCCIAQVNDCQPSDAGKTDLLDEVEKFSHAWHVCFVLLFYFKIIALQLELGEILLLGRYQWYIPKNRLDLMQ